MKSVLTMKYPSSWHGEMWREAAPCGNGTVGALVYGGTDREIILLNHTALWRGGHVMELPDVHDSLAEIRRLLDDNRPDLAEGVLSNALRQAGYQAKRTVPFPLCDIRINRLSNLPIFGYRRKIFLDRAEVVVGWREGDANFTRSTFISRADGLCYVKLSCDKPGQISISAGLDIHDPETMQENLIQNRSDAIRGSYACYAAANQSVYKPADGDYGAVLRIIPTHGTVTDDGKLFTLTDADEVLLVTGVFVGEERESGWNRTQAALAACPDYDTAMEAHLPLHRALYEGTEFTISDTDTSVEEMLLDAYGNGASNELMESMYAYGRYLFICSTDKPGTTGMPTHLIGLWNGTYRCFWAFHMFNVNFEMIYWQALSGNLPELLRTALDYVESQMDGYRENARKLWGCRGIWINSVNTPESGRSAAMNNHIINWTTGAGWVAQHFYDYYRYTGDVEYLREHALPFMKEAAEFFEDFLYIGKDGKYEFSPSVSPENVPLNVSRDLGSRSEVTKNAAMDVAITRELLTNLLEGARLCGMYEEKLPVWEKMLTLLPEYRFNADGSLKEWIHDFYEDQNSHRHHSHVYGVFPGHSINRMSPEYDAFVKAEDNRLAYGLKAQSSWSAVYMAGVNARMGRGDISHLVLSEMLRTCLMGNLFTVHNDWRRTGSLSCDDFQIAPFQIDANIGFTAIVNEMLVGCADGTIRLLPALPTQWKSGEIKNVRTVGGWLVSIRWNEDGAKAKIRGGWAASAKVCCGDGWRFADGSTEKEITGDGTIVNLCRVQSDA